MVEKILSEPDSSIVLVVPRGADLGDSASNFHLLRREAEAGGKHLSIESVDERILALAKSSEIEALHPLLDTERRGPSLSDIVAVPENDSRKSAAKMKKQKVGKKTQQQEGGLKEEKMVQFTAKRETAPPKYSPQEEADGSEEFVPEGRSLKKKFIIGTVVAIAILIGSTLIINRFWSHATVVINFKKTPWVYENNFLADTAVSKANFEKNVLPGELFTLQKNLTQLFPASGIRQVSVKATGKITIYNAYSSKPQTLVATTRFLAPDGKIFRLQDKVLIPGAEIKNSNILPAHTEANVVADQAGPAYNVGPVAKLTIPGFQGTPRYNGFYGELKGGTSGGFVGKKSVPTDDDIKKAKDSTAGILRASLESNFLTSYPPAFKILDGAKTSSITKLSVNENTDQSGKFSVFGEATLKALGFRESDTKSFLAALSSRDNPGSVFKELNLDYSGVKLDLKNGRLSFKLTSRGVLWPAFSTDDFEKKISGQKVADVRSLVAGLTGLLNAKVSLWPIWLGSVPADSKKVEINVN